VPAPIGMTRRALGRAVNRQIARRGQITPGMSPFRLGCRAFRSAEGSRRKRRLRV